ncbi:MAG: tetratricopeptide repeat protein, partial [Gammaproteobacteria bacterium]
AAEADAVIRKAIAAYPKAPQLQQLLGEALFAQHKAAASEKAFSKAIALQPKWWKPYDSLAKARMAEGHAQAAMATYQQGLKAIPDNQALMLGLALTHSQTGDFDGAAKVYEQILAKQPGNVVAANNLASLIADHRSNDPASLAKAKKLVAQFGSSKQLAFLDTYGWVHYRLGDLDKAAKALSEVVQKAPKVPVFQYHLGMVYYKQGNKTAAKEHLTKALAGGAQAPWAGAARRALNSVG